MRTATFTDCGAAKDDLSASWRGDDSPPNWVNTDDERMRDMKKRLNCVTGISCAVLAMAILCASPAMAESGAKEELKPQTTCPIMGGKINPDLFVDAAGYRIYMCCAACEDKIKADPAAAVAVLKEKGERPEVRPLVCAKCGEIKGGAKCCKPGAAKCPNCGLNKGSIGCCKDLKADVELCAKCGEAKGSANCCKPDVPKCAKCGLHKGSPGCCTAENNAVLLCAKCGEVKGGTKCCKPGAEKCPKCNLNKGAPGCCKLGALPSACTSTATSCCASSQ